MKVLSTASLLFLLFFGNVLHGSLIDAGRQQGTFHHITVRILGPMVNQWENSGFRIFRCTNHTRQDIPLKLSLRIDRTPSGTPSFVSTRITLRSRAVCDIPLSAPGFPHFTTFTPEVQAPDGVSVELIKISSPHSRNQIVSSSIRPDFFEFMLDDYHKIDTPVGKWPLYSEAYAGLSTILLDSKDKLSPELMKTLQLAAASGTNVVVLVMGNTPFPEYAAAGEKKGIFKKEIGFGTWSVIRTRAVPSDPEWKKFTDRKYELSRKHGKHHHKYRREKWIEKELIQLLEQKTPAWGKSFANDVHILPPAIPLGNLVLLMLGFVLIAGPLNYHLLKRKNLELWGVLTIPAISFIFCAAVTICVVAGENLYSEGKGKVETRLDQISGIIASTGGFSIYSPLSRKDFSFDRKDIISFLEYGRINGTVIKDKVYFSSSLVPSRMSCLYSVSKAEYTGKKLEIIEKKDSIELVNSLGTTVNKVCVQNSRGQHFLLSVPLLPGAKAVLQKCSQTPPAFRNIGPNSYCAEITEPFHIAPGLMADKYTHSQKLYGKWK